MDEVQATQMIELLKSIDSYLFSLDDTVGKIKKKLDDLEISLNDIKDNVL